MVKDRVALMFVYVATQIANQYILKEQPVH